MKQYGGLNPPVLPQQLSDDDKVELLLRVIVNIGKDIKENKATEEDKQLLSYLVNELNQLKESQGDSKKQLIETIE